MPIVTRVICDVCGTKGEANHWYKVLGRDDMVVLQPFEGWVGATGSELPGARVICCGQACAIQVIAQWMDSRVVGQTKTVPMRVDDSQPYGFSTGEAHRAEACVR